MRVDDVLSDLDLLTIDRQVFTHFGQQSHATVADKRRIAVSDWLAGELKVRGFDPTKHITRRAANYINGFTGGQDTDFTDDLADRQSDASVDLHDVFVTPADDSLLVGHIAPFKGLTFVVGNGDGNVSSLSIASLTYWNGTQWRSLGANSLIDGTRLSEVSSISLAGGGTFRFTPPDDWEQLEAASVTDPWLYMVLVRFTTRPSAGTLVRQIVPTRQSRLTYAAGLYTLHLLSLEAAKGSRSDWDDRAEMYAKKAYSALERDLNLAQDEFDVDNSGAASETEASSITAPANLHTWERG